MRTFFHTPSRTLTGQTWYRQVLPAKILGQTAKADISEHDIAYHDIFTFSRLLKPDTIQLIVHLKELGKKVYWELDDDLWSIPGWNPASEVYKGSILDLLDTTIEVVDGVLASTEPLANVVRRRTNKRVHVLPNLVDMNEWPRVQREERDTVRVLWAGSVHHRKDLEVAAPALRRLLALPHVQVYFMGDMPDSMGTFTRIPYSHLGTMIPSVERVGFIEHVALQDYAKTLQIIAPDVAICPLAPCFFNLSKSPIKWLEMSLAGAAVVASDLPPYSDCPIRASSSEEWEQALFMLCGWGSCRDGVARRARGFIEHHHSWQGFGRRNWDKLTWGEL